MSDIDSSAAALFLPPVELARGRQAIAEARPLRITVFGSSTTEGVGASSPEASFPAVMCRFMLRHLPEIPGGAIVLRNRGIGGDNARDLHARLESVTADAPDLVLFQTGSNDPLQEVPLETFEHLTGGDLARLRAATSADLVLIDQQLCRMLEECPAFPPFLASLHRIGQQQAVAVFPRYRLMQSWCEMPGMTRDALSPDGLHMGDHGYALLGAALSGWLLAGLGARL